MNLVPLPRQITPRAGRVSLTDAWKLDAPEELQSLECLADLKFLNPGARKTLRLRIDVSPAANPLSPQRGEDAPSDPLSPQRACPERSRGRERARVRGGEEARPLTAADEAYRLELMPERIEMSAGTVTGIIRGVQTLRQLEREGDFDGCLIEDEPALAIRAFHIDFRPKSYRLDYLLRTIDRLAELKYNFLLIEWENKFPYTRRPEVVHPEALTPDEVAQLKRRCAKYAIEIMPLVQTFGHLEFALSVPSNAHLREVSDDPSEICPLNGEAVAFVKSLVRDIIDGHPESRFIHLGADETYVLGTCPACRANCEKVGRSAHFIGHMKEIARVVLDSGKTPVMWNDMLIAHPEAVEMLGAETVLLDWHYHVFGVYSEEISAWWHPDGKLTADNAHRSPEPHRTEYVPYYAHRHPSNPKALRSFPYIRYFQDRGFRVIVGPSSCCHGDPGTNPNSLGRVPNIWGAAASAVLDGALGCALTSWQVRRHPWEVQWYCVALSAETSWNPHEGVRVNFDERFCRSQYGIDDASIPQAFGLLDRGVDEDRLDHYGGWNNVLRMWSGRPVAEQLKEKDGKGQLADDAPATAKAAETLRRARKALAAFRRFVSRARRNAPDAAFWKLAAEETVFRVELFDVLRRTYLARKAGGAPGRPLEAAVRKAVKKGDALYGRARELWKKLLPPQTLREELFIRWDDVRSYLTETPAG